MVIATDKIDKRPFIIRFAKEKGFATLWRGNLANVIRYSPTQALNFAFKDTYKRYLNPFNPKTEFWFFLGNFASGGAAGATSLLFVYPLDFARRRLATDIGKDKRQFTGLVDCMTKISKSDGPQGLYRGFGVAVLGTIAYRGVYFGGYDTLNRTLLSQDSNIIFKFSVALCVTTLANLFSYPLDTVRRRLLMQSSKKEVLYTGNIDCFIKIAKNEGPKGFFRGALYNIKRGVANGSLVLVLFDELKAIVAPISVKKA